MPEFHPAHMSPEVQQYIQSLMEDLPGLESADVPAINAVNSQGENALHIAIQSGDTEMAKRLIDKGIDIHQPGDLGRTPLHEACSFGNMEVVRALVERGADLFALTEGDPPFTLARFSKRDDICDYLAVEMRNRQAQDPAIWTRARIRQLQMEIARLEKALPEADTHAAQRKWLALREASAEPRCQP